MKLFFTLFLLTYTQAFFPLANPKVTDLSDFKYCNTNYGKNIKINSFDFENGEKGKTLHISLSGTALNDMVTTQVLLDMRRPGYLPFYLHYKLYEFVNNLSAGDDFVFELDKDIPRLIPSGTYNSQILFMGVKHNDV